MICDKCGALMQWCVYNLEKSTAYYICRQCGEVTKNEQKTDKETFEKTDSQTPIR